MVIDLCSQRYKKIFRLYGHCESELTECFLGCQLSSNCRDRNRWSKVDWRFVRAEDHFDLGFNTCVSLSVDRRIRSVEKIVAISRPSHYHLRRESRRRIHCVLLYSSDCRDEISFFPARTASIDCLASSNKMNQKQMETLYVSRYGMTDNSIQYRHRCVLTWRSSRWHCLAVAFCIRSIERPDEVVRQPSKEQQRQAEMVHSFLLGAEQQIHFLSHPYFFSNARE